MSPIVANTTYRAVCDLCAVYRCSAGWDTPDGARDWAEERGWLIVGPLTICNMHDDADDCHGCGAAAERRNWAGNCADCWRRAMELPRGTCDRDAAGDAWTLTEAMWCQPPHPRTIHACTQLRDSHGSHPGPHQCPCGAEWGQR